MSEDVNKKEEVKKELTKEESRKIERDFMEEGEPITLRDGVTYIIPPLLLKDARKLMRKLETIDIDYIITNFIEDENGETGEEALYEVLLMGFKANYPDMTKEELENICDLRQAKKLITIMIDLNGLKK